MGTHYAMLCHMWYYCIRISNGVEYIGKEHSYKKFYKRSYAVNLSDLSNRIEKKPDKICFISTLIDREISNIISCFSLPFNERLLQIL